MPTPRSDATASRTPGRPLVRVPVPPGAAGPAALLPALAAALDGSGPPIPPIPTVSASVSTDYVASLLRAVRADDPRTPLESSEVAVVATTSGSTGDPRGVLLTAAQLTSMSTIVNGAGPPPAWVAALPVTSIGGLNVLVRALAAGIDPVALPSIGGAGPFTPAAFHAAVGQAGQRSGDVRVAIVPAQLARLLSDDAGVAALRACTLVLVGGAATRGSLLTMAEQLGIAVTTTYGATETSGGCVFDGRPLPGVSVTAQAETGHLTISGPCVAMGYRCEPALTAEGFTDAGFEMPDIGSVGPDGHVTVLGRADDVVVVKGVNVSPDAVGRIAADLPDVVAAAAVGVHPRGGDPSICVFVEVRDAAPDVEVAVRDAVVRRLGPVARPASVRRVPRLPHLPNGKVDRRLLTQWAESDERTD